MQNMRTFLKSTIGERAYGQLRQWRREFKQWLFFRQRIVEVQVGKFILTAPSSHLLWRNRGNRAQPLRDQFIGLAAREVLKKYPEATILDVGANIGDTAAMIASYTTAPLILVEPSDYFLSFLAKNVQKLPIQIKAVHQVLISANREETGILHHSGGTATLHKSVNARKQWACKRLSEVADAHTRLIKIDTDGFDYQIIASARDYLIEAAPCLIFENQVETVEQLAEAQANLELLLEVGYKWFVVWDDPGYLMLMTKDLGVLRQLNEYLFIQAHMNSQVIFNLDVLAITEADEDIAQAVVTASRNGADRNW